MLCDAGRRRRRVTATLQVVLEKYGPNAVTFRQIGEDNLSSVSAAAQLWPRFAGRSLAGPLVAEPITAVWEMRSRNRGTMPTSTTAAICTSWPRAVPARSGGARDACQHPWTDLSSPPPESPQAPSTSSSTGAQRASDPSERASVHWRYHTGPGFISSPSIAEGVVSGSHDGQAAYYRSAVYGGWRCTRRQMPRGLRGWQRRYGKGVQLQRCTPCPLPGLVLCRHADRRRRQSPFLSARG